VIGGVGTAVRERYVASGRPAFEFRVPFLGREEEAKRSIWIVVESRVLASHITTRPLGSLPFGASQIKSTILTRFENAQ
jgi:hypothetical protein